MYFTVSQIRTLFTIHDNKNIGLQYTVKSLHLWLAAALQTSMMDFFQIFWAWTASWSSPQVDLQWGGQFKDFKVQGGGLHNQSVLSSCLHVMKTARKIKILILHKRDISLNKQEHMWTPTAERMRLDCWPGSRLCSAGMKGHSHLRSRWLPFLPQINTDPLPPHTLPSPLLLQGLLHSLPPPPLLPGFRNIQT